MKPLIRKCRLVISLAVLSLPTYAQPDGLSDKLRNAIEGRKAEIGIAIIIDGKDTVTINNANHYPLFSVFKFHQALAVMNHLNRHNLSIDTLLHISPSDLKPDTYSPLRDKYPNGNIDMSIANLLEYTLQQSDNNACDILFQHTGGPLMTDSYIRSLGIQDFAIVATEDDMHKNIETSYNNRTTPLAAAELLEIFLNKRLFPSTYQDFIRKSMIECQTGKDRLPQPLSDTQAIIGHKTGSGAYNSKGQRMGTNDIGFVFLPNGHHYSIAVFVKDSEESDETNAQIIATISRIAYEYVVQKPTGMH